MFVKKKRKKVTPEFSKNLKDLGYCIEEEGRLKTLKGEPYEFEVRKNDKSYNLGLYEVLIELIGEWVQKSLQKDHGMVQTLLPIGADKKDIHTKIYVSPDYMTNDKMIIFIPGTSYPIGIWSKRVLLDESIVNGSMIAYTKRARELGLSVVITNPNEVFWYKGRAVLTIPRAETEFSTIPGSESPENHTDYVFKNFVIPSAARKIVIVANSYGGHCAVDVLKNNFDKLKDRVKAIEFTASAHSIDFVQTNKMKTWIRERCRNWTVSDQPVGKEVIDTRLGCISISSGSEFNEFTTSNVTDEVFSFIERKIISPSEDEGNGEDFSDDDLEMLKQEAERFITLENPISEKDKEGIEYEEASSSWTS